MGTPVKLKNGFVLDNVSVEVGNQQNRHSLLSAISCQIHPGDLISVIGPNGSGKTTLLRTLLGLQTICTGNIALNGVPLAQWSRKQLSQQVAYVPQQLESIYNQSALSVAMFLRLSRYPHLGFLRQLTAHDRSVVHQAIEQTHIAPLLNRQMGQLSGGERQTVLIAAALAQSPEIILLDEPLANLDPKNQVEILSLLTRLYCNRKQTTTPLTMVMVTHDINNGLFPLPEGRLLALKSGQLFYTGDIASFLTPACLEKLYETPFYVVKTQGKPHPVVIPV